MTIYKYLLKPQSVQTVEMPKGAQILTAQFQNKTICLWALLNLEGFATKRTIEICGTGLPLDFHPRVFISTVQDPVNGLVWHIFERP